MRVQLLGTGSADRWPNPWCGCDRCAWARSGGWHRARTSALVDGHLLVDPGPDVGAGGHDLTHVRTVLVTHDHPDHLDPAFLLAWAWAHGPRLVVAGPLEAIDRCRDWVGPQAPVEFRALAAGDRLRAGDLQVRALPAAHSTRAGRDPDGTALLFEVVGSDAALLYATDTAAVPHDDLADRYDLVLLELTFGDTLDHGTAHLDLASFGHEVARLRADGRLAPGARVVAVHLSHHNPTDLAERLAGLGAEVLPDGTVLAIGGSGPRRGRRLLVTGGARSGKSVRAEQLAGPGPVTYVATGPAYPDDPEWTARVEAHRARRPSAWRERETTDVPGVIASAGAGERVLVDCLALWVTGLVDAAGAWQQPGSADAAVRAGLAALLEALATSPADVVLVTNEVGSGVVPATASGRMFRDLLGRVNSAVAESCDDVELVTCGIPRLLKGQPWQTPT